jgi:hypothetical protein
METLIEIQKQIAEVERKISTHAPGEFDAKKWSEMNAEYGNLKALERTLIGGGDAVADFVRVAELQAWFNWYDGQTAQALRAQRTGQPWSASDGVKSYTSIDELDAEANAKQNEIRVLQGKEPITTELL